MNKYYIYGGIVLALIVGGLLYQPCKEAPKQLTSAVRLECAIQLVQEAQSDTEAFYKKMCKGIEDCASITDQQVDEFVQEYIEKCQKEKLEAEGFCS